MSKFTSQEVEALQKGGNQRAREIYLKDWDSQKLGLPDNSTADEIWEFIKNVYIDKKFVSRKSSEIPPRDSQKDIGSSSNETPEKPEPAEDWTIVLPRRGKQSRRNFSKIMVSEVSKQVQPWVPTDLEWQLEREVILMHKMESSLQKLEKSQFYKGFLDQIQAREMSEQFARVRGSYDKMQMVIYGIGSIESFESPRLQLSLAILMKRRFGWIGNVEVFDPIISFTESKVLEAFGCVVLSVNEQGQRRASKPTLFFMPHCDAQLYDNLLLANWRADLLNQIVLFGNSFSEYDEQQQRRSFCHNPSLSDTKKHIRAIHRFTKEYAIGTITDEFFRAFNSSSWHFFSLDSEQSFAN